VNTKKSTSVFFWGCDYVRKEEEGRFIYCTNLAKNIANNIFDTLRINVKYCYVKLKLNLYKAPPTTVE